MIYEVTIRLPNGDWMFWRGDYPDFQSACEAGIDRTKQYPETRLLSIVPAGLWGTQQPEEESDELR